MRNTIRRNRLSEEQFRREFAPVRPCLSVTGELDKAAQTYQQFIENYPRESEAYYELGSVFASQGLYEKSRDVLRQSLRLAPDSSGGGTNLVNVLLALLGEGDDALREKVKKLLAEGHRVVVNLTELEHIDSMGLATIAGLHRLDNSRIKLVCSSVYLTGLLRRTRLNTVIRFYETEDEAAAVVSGHGALLSPSLAA